MSMKSQQMKLWNYVYDKKKYVRKYYIFIVFKYKTAFLNFLITSTWSSIELNNEKQ